MSLRPARAADVPEITALFLAARRTALPYLPELHTDAETQAFLAGVVAAGGVTVVESGGRVVGFLALAGARVDHLYVDPTCQGRGHGSALLRAAQAACPAGLDLWVFQRNRAAIAFYEAHGFAVVERTDGARNEEREPDARMAWSY
jgi:ribosomal protein S18 acetylase RimI-like enzyme